jgi:segregation and condensation protein B
MEIDIAVSESAPTSQEDGSPSGPRSEPELAEKREQDTGEQDRDEASGVEDSAAKPEKIKLGPGEAKSDAELQRELAALLFASPEPLSAARLVELLERPTPARVTAALERLQSELESGAAALPVPLVLRKIGGAWRLLSDPELAPVIARLRAEPKPERISAAALETLAIIAYRQPVSKAEIEAIRGVQAGPVLRSLVDRGLVRITGRAELPGQPLLYGTTKEFLERFGLSALKDLPRDGELNED